jgi:hypothetical protein
MSQSTPRDRYRDSGQLATLTNAHRQRHQTGPHTRLHRRPR